jgi:hypothetical protein
MSDPIDPTATYLYKMEQDASKGMLLPALRDKLSSAKKMLKFLDYVPDQYKSGPWSPIAHLTIFGLASFLLLTLPNALDTHTTHDYFQAQSTPWLQTFRLIIGLYGIGHIIFTFYQLGLWPFTSYTLTSWNLLTVRMLSAYLASSGFSTQFIADATRFPALVMCTLTVFIWWGILVPLIHHLLRSNIRELKSFWEFNCSLPLINVHLLNLPLIAIEFLSSKQALTFFDLYSALFIALVYVLFYLNVLDPLGLHFYIILTPRSKFCMLAYGVVLGLYTGLFYFWNGLL